MAQVRSCCSACKEMCISCSFSPNKWSVEQVDYPGENLAAELTHEHVQGLNERMCHSGTLAVGLRLLCAGFVVATRMCSPPDAGCCGACPGSYGLTCAFRQNLFSSAVAPCCIQAVLGHKHVCAAPMHVVYWTHGTLQATNFVHTSLHDSGVAIKVLDTDTAGNPVSLSITPLPLPLN
jgi:hypothetical protein